jgi:hypothetical protein
MTTTVRRIQRPMKRWRASPVHDEPFCLRQLRLLVDRAALGGHPSGLLTRPTGLDWQSYGVMTACLSQGRDPDGISWRTKMEPLMWRPRPLVAAVIILLLELLELLELQVVGLYCLLLGRPDVPLYRL